MSKKILACVSPIALIALCHFFVVFLYKTMGFGQWVFVPAFIMYWGLSHLIVLKLAGVSYIKNLFHKPVGKIGWLILSVIVGFLPFSILLMNLSIITVPLMLLSVLFSVINPFFEELYWRGFVLDYTFRSKLQSSIYSSILFILSHIFIWGVFSYGDRNLHLIIALTIMSIVWCIVRIKTKSLWWCIVSHFFVDLFNLLVFVMLNIYIPKQGFIPQLDIILGTLQ
jgi:membrane protease YdiL (CAAX protease family)